MKLVLINHILNVNLQELTCEVNYILCGFSWNKGNSYIRTPFRTNDYFKIDCL